MSTYICKLTNGCNMKCSYCCVGDKTTYKIISPEQFYSNILFIARNIISLNEKCADIILHGGEATLFSSDDCHNAINRIESEYPDIKFNWKLQTNGCRLSDNWIKLLKDHKFSVGISIDGFAEHHDLTRKDCGNNNTFDKIKCNIIKLKKNNIPVSALMVVTKYAIDKGFDFLKWYSDNNIPIKINPLLKCGEAVNKKELFLDSGDYSDYLISAFEYVVSNELKLTINPIDDMFNRIVNDLSCGECTFSEDCSKSFMAVDYEGNIYPCGRFCDEALYSMGNVNNITEYPFNKPNEVTDKIKGLRIKNKCISCKFVKFCNGGCPFINYISSDGEVIHNPLCEDYQKIYRYIITDGIELICDRLEKRRESLIKG